MAVPSSFSMSHTRHAVAARPVDDAHRQLPADARRGTRDAPVAIGVARDHDDDPELRLGRAVPTASARAAVRDQKNWSSM